MLIPDMTPFGVLAGPVIGSSTVFCFIPMVSGTSCDITIGSVAFFLFLKSLNSLIWTSLDSMSLLFFLLLEIEPYSL